VDLGGPAVFVQMGSLAPGVCALLVRDASTSRVIWGERGGIDREPVYRTHRGAEQ